MEAYEARKKGKKTPLASLQKRFYTRPVVTETHEQQQARIARERQSTDDE